MQPYAAAESDAFGASDAHDVAAVSDRQRGALNLLTVLLPDERLRFALNALDVFAAEDGGLGGKLVEDATFECVLSQLFPRSAERDGTAAERARRRNERDVIVADL